MAELDFNEMDDRRLSYRLLSDVLNSRTDPLTAGETWNGTSFDVEGYEYVVLSFFADQDAKVYIRYCNDGTNWDAEEVYDYTGGNRLGLEIKVMGPEALIKIENDSGADMTTMRMHARGRV